jgi:hypothetical protein
MRFSAIPRLPRPPRSDSQPHCALSSNRPMKMRFSAFGLALTLSSPVAFAQGLLNFANFGSGANAPVYDEYGTKLAGTNFQADLYWAPGIVADSNELTPLRQPAYFTSCCGYFLGGARGLSSDNPVAQLSLARCAFGIRFTGDPGNRCSKPSAAGPAHPAYFKFSSSQIPPQTA